MFKTINPDSKSGGFSNNHPQKCLCAASRLCIDVNRDYTPRQFPSLYFLLWSNSSRHYIIKRLGVEFLKLRSLILCSYKFKEKSDHPLPESHTCTHMYFIASLLSFLCFPISSAFVNSLWFPVVCKTLPLTFIWILTSGNLLLALLTQTSAYSYLFIQF